MAIEKMKRLKLVAVKSERESLLKELMLLGCVQISEPELHSPDAEEAEIFTKETAGLSEFRADYERLLSGIELLNKYVPEKTGLFSPKPEVSRQSVLDESSLKEYIELAKSLDDADDKIKRLAVEAGTPLGWERYVGSYGDAIGIDHFGASAPYKRIKEEFGFTAERIAERAQRLMAE